MYPLIANSVAVLVEAEVYTRMACKSCPLTEQLTDAKVAETAVQVVCCMFMRAGKVTTRREELV